MKQQQQNELPSRFSAWRDASIAHETTEWADQITECGLSTIYWRDNLSCFTRSAAMSCLDCCSAMLSSPCSSR